MQQLASIGIQHVYIYIYSWLEIDHTMIFTLGEGEGLFHSELSNAFTRLIKNLSFQ